MRGDKDKVDADGNPINPTHSYIKKVANGVTMWTDELHDNSDPAGFVKETEAPTNYLEKLGVYAQQEKIK